MGLMKQLTKTESQWKKKSICKTVALYIFAMLCCRVYREVRGADYLAGTIIGPAKTKSRAAVAAAAVGVAGCITSEC